MKKRSVLTLQNYPRVPNELLADWSLFPPLDPPLDEKLIENAINNAFNRCLKNKQGKTKKLIESPEELVEMCINHLKTRSDPIIGPSFVSQINVSELFEFDAVSHEMQRNRMTIGIFYQYLLLELMRHRWPVFDGYREGDIIADIKTPNFETGIRLYMSVKKSLDTVGGQDIGGVIRRLEDMAKEEKNLNSPYLCVICVATPANGRLRDYHDRHVKCNKYKQPYSLNCEYWGPGFVFPYITGKPAIYIYKQAIKQVSNYLPFMSLKFKQIGAELLREKLNQLKLLNSDETINDENFLNFIIGEHNV
jgi:hypothetical protein